MYLHLQNFCCWEDKAFHFPEEGSILISAPSGSGKTSIVRAIMFALFGVGDKIVMHGKRSCSVELKLKDLHIIRKKGPGRLIVNQTYEDQAGQCLIQKYFDNELFYLQQGGRNSFITLSALDKLAFLEKIIFQQIPIQEIKTQLKTSTKEVENQLLVKKSESNTIDTFLSEIHIPKEYQHQSFSLERFESLKLKYSQIQAQLDTFKTSQIQVKAIQTQITQLESLIQSLEETETHQLQEKEEYQQKLINVSSDSNEIILYEQYAVKIEKQQKLESLLNELSDKQTLYSNIIKTERESIEQKIFDLESDMERYCTTKEYQSEIKRIEINHQKEAQLNALKQELVELSIPSFISSSIIDSLNDIKIQISDIEKKERELEQTLQEIEKSYECPKCNSILKIQNHTLVENPVEMDRSECIQRIAELKEKKKKSNDILNQLQEYSRKKEYLEAKIRREEREISENNKKNEGDNNARNKSIESLKQELLELTLKNQTLNDYYDQLDTIVEKYDSLDKQIQALELRTNKMSESLQSLVQVPDHLTLDAIRTFIADSKSNLKMREKYQSLLNRVNDQLESTRQAITKHLNIQEQKKSEYAELMDGLRTIPNATVLETELKQTKYELEFESELQKYQKSKDLLDKYTIQKDENTTQLKELETQLVNYMVFKEKIAEAESVALTNLIQTINTNVQLYLDAFFEKEPIQVSLSAFKMVKDTKKTQLNLVVHYKGNQIELSNLSGGEYDRVVLAFTLTFAELTQSPILLLDECVSSLDQENAENVFDCIKSHCKNKLIILIAHQIVTGMFDETIQLS